jgi:cytochrome c553
MNKLMLAVVLVASATVLAAEPKKAEPKKEAAPKFELKGDAAKGEATYKQLCNSCHGDSGKGDGVAGAALNPKPADFTDAKRAAAGTDEYIYKMIKDGGAANGKSPMMVAWGPVLAEDQKIRDVAAYVRSLSKPAAPAKDTKKAPAPAKK